MGATSSWPSANASTGLRPARSVTTVICLIGGEPAQYRSFAVSSSLSPETPVTR